MDSIGSAHSALFSSRFPNLFKRALEARESRYGSLSLFRLLAEVHNAAICRVADMSPRRRARFRVPALLDLLLLTQDDRSIADEFVDAMDPLLDAPTATAFRAFARTLIEPIVDDLLAELPASVAPPIALLTNSEPPVVMLDLCSGPRGFSLSRLLPVGSSLFLNDCSPFVAVELAAFISSSQADPVATTRILETPTSSVVFPASSIDILRARNVVPYLGRRNAYSEILRLSACVKVGGLILIEADGNNFHQLQSVSRLFLTVAKRLPPKNWRVLAPWRLQGVDRSTPSAGICFERVPPDSYIAHDESLGRAKELAESLAQPLLDNVSGAGTEEKQSEKT